MEDMQFDKWQLQEFVKGLRTYERALRQAPHQRHPLLSEDAAKHEARRVQQLAEKCVSAIAHGRDRLDGLLLRSVSDAEFILLEAARGLTAAAKSREFEREIDALKNRKAGPATLETQRDLDMQLEDLGERLGNERGRFDSLKDVSSDLLLTADQVLDICEGADVSDPRRDIL